MPLAPVQVDLVVSRSRFLGLLEGVENADEARARLKTLKNLHADASHVVHAFVLGEGNTRTLGCSDDGEPPGTAGRPVLDVLAGSGGANVFVAVVRWFGGTKLGTGGLVKAYGDTAKALLGLVRWKERRELVRLTLEAPYDALQPLETLLKLAEAELEAQDFAESVRLTAAVPRETLGALQERTRDLLRGKAQWQRIGDDA